MSASPRPSVRGCLPEHAAVPAVQVALDVLADAKVTRADLASEEAHQVRNLRCTVGAVVAPHGRASSVIVEWYEDGAVDEALLPARRIQTVRSARNRALDECAGLLRDIGYTVTSSESSLTRTRRLHSLLVSGAPYEPARNVTRALTSRGLSRAGVLPPYWETPDLYRVMRASGALLLTFSHATKVERVRDAVATLRARGLNASEDAPSLYGVLVRRGERPTGERDGLRPETPECQAARDLLWARGFSREDCERGTIGHRVYPQLPPHLRDGVFNVDNTSPTVLAALHDRVSVTAPDLAYAEGHGRDLATALSAAHEVAFAEAGWSVVREDPITITAHRASHGRGPRARCGTGGRRSNALTSVLTTSAPRLAHRAAQHPSAVRPAAVRTKQSATG
ncbi:hypothetical protein PUR61_38660 [Streptomyces sp. BE20]|uniref:hypothetical protein n=1 Tax=Streptomyces sp. BE20 TaxID=3002525 RepID=UPI002E7755A2|nr:hypothetical protein [Streptomyces sp. BE20]MEE1828059.1 hypothetical protein [Streptomyces sp. BE20]